MLILAGVTITTLLGNNGIITKAQESKNVTEKDAEDTDKAMSELTDKMHEALGEDIPLEKVAVNEKASKNSTINGQAPSATNPIIPKGYIPIDTNTSSPTEENVNKGLVITDSVNASGESNGNEWVWVPVPTPSDLYVTVKEPIAITGCSDEAVVSDVFTSKYTKSEIISGKIRVKPNETKGYREPDIVVDSDGESYDAVKANLEAAGFSSIKNMAETMVKDYDEMTKSLEKYKGFYIGRYELSNEGVQRYKKVLRSLSWYELYAKCKTLKASEKVETRMIWGLQWDATCNWIANYGDKKNITDSSSWGNYAIKNDDGSETFVNARNTGDSKYWQANNIYDLAGNFYEWTQEAYGTIYGTNNRAVRGR